MFDKEVEINVLTDLINCPDILHVLVSLIESLIAGRVVGLIINERELGFLN